MLRIQSSTLKAAVLALALLTAAAGAQPVPDPKNPNPDIFQPAPIPPLAVANTSTRAFPLLVAPNNTLPVTDVEIRTVGGIAPVKFAIVGGEAASMFQLVSTQTQTIVKVPTEAEEAAAIMKARAERKPAGTVTRILRFKGATNASALPSALPVQVRATDVFGDDVIMTVTAHPFAPRVAPVTANRTALETWPLTLSVQGLGNADRMRVDSVAGSGCNFTQNNNIIYQQEVQVINGTGNVFRRGSFRTSAASCSALRVTVAVRFPQATAFSAPIVLAVPTFNFRAPQTYAFGNTWQLKDFLGVKVHRSITGTCSGDSFGHPVGVFKASDDITFSIRSGPLGTECEYATVVKRLADGFVLSKLEFVKSEGPNNSLTNVQMAEPRRYCKIGGSGGTVGGVSFDLSRGMNVLREADLLASSGPDLSDFVLTGFNRPLETSDNVTLLGSTDTDFAVVLIPMYLKLRCVITPTNSEFYTLRLNRAEFIGPPGVAFP